MHSLVQGNARGIGRSNEPVEDPNRCGGLDKGGWADDCQQAAAKGCELIGSARCGLCEFGQQLTVINARHGFGRRARSRRRQVRRRSQRIAALTEQHHMGGRSVEALVDGGDPGCHELDLRTTEGAVLPDEFGEIRERVHRAHEPHECHVIAGCE
jgi:hypothetical protein